jgi:hypothetical protein
MISFTPNCVAMFALMGALAFGRSTAQDYCTATQLAVYSCSASSVESNHFVADWAVDNNPNTRWASEGPGADGASAHQWFELDLGGQRFIDSINIQWEAAYSETYTIQISYIGVVWETVHSFSNGIGGEVEVSMLDRTARYVRIVSTKGNPTWGISLYEVKIFGDSDATCIDGPATCRQTGIHAVAASASSEEGSHWVPENAIDEDWTTRWSSEFHEDEWFAVDLGAQTLVYSVWLFWETAYAGSYKVQTAESLNGTWTTIDTMWDSDGEVDIVDGLHAVTKYVRILSIDRATRYGNSLWEFDVRGTQDTNCTSPAGWD